MSEPPSSDAASSNVPVMKPSTNTKMEALLEQLRTKHSAQKSTQNGPDNWFEFAKQIRMASLELKQQFREPAVVHESLEKLQSVMSANSLTQILERIDSACQKLGLKYSAQGNTVYISTDLFYIDLQCDPAPNSQSVRDVRVAHHGSQPTSVPAMTQALRQSNVQLFMEHIKGLMDMYNVDSEQSVKTKFFIVQQSLETDIEKINKVQMQSKSISLGAHIYKLPLGLVQSRNGGLPTKLTFFITPYDFLNEKEQTSYPMSLDSIKNLDLGVSATIGIEQRSTQHQLQTIPLMNCTRTADNRLVTQFVQSTNINSVLMPAAFILKFKKPIAISEQFIKQIERLQGACTFNENVEMMPMLDAIVKSSGVSIPAGTDQFTVALPGQVQNYYINELKTNGEKMMGGLVYNLPFTHPTFIPPVIAILRQQLMLNTMILSCVRSHKDAKLETKALNMELKVVSNQMLTVTFKHPFADSVATVDIDITDVSSPKCSVYCSQGEICSNAQASKVIQRCFSIPITMRCILQQAGHQEENLPPPTKKVKAEHGEIMQKLRDIYTSRGHYIPYGSVNTASTTYTKNISTNKYSLCLRRFSGYKRSCFTSLDTNNSLSNSLDKTQSTGGKVNTHPIPATATDKTKLSNTTPVLSSLLDDRDITSTAHPLVLEPTQDATPQQQQQPMILTELLGGPEGLNTADKKSKKPKPKKRTLSTEGASVPQSPNTAARKRKKSDNDEIVRELTSKVKMEVNDLFTSTSSYEKTGDLSMHQGTKLTLSKSLSGESHLAMLLDMDDDKKPKTVTKTFADLFDMPKQLKQESMQAEHKSPSQSLGMAKVTKARKSTEERKTAKAESLGKEKKQKTVENKAKDVKSTDQLPPESPVKKTLTKTTSKPKMKLQVQRVESLPTLPVKNAEDRSSPKEKVKKQGSEKEKKKRAPKSPSTGEASSKQSAQDILKMGFYGASNLKALPKIPKRSQPSPTPETPPPISQKSPVPGEWQRTSPVPNRSMPAKINEQHTAPITNRSKSFPSPILEVPAKRPALLPTPSTPPIEVNPQPQGIFQRKNSLNDVIHRLSQPGPSDGFQPAKYGKPTVEPSPNSPDELTVVESQPVQIPTQPTHEDPASPTPEMITQAPKAIPLDPGKRSATPPSSSSYSDVSKPMLVKQKAVSRPLTFSPKPMGDNRLDDDLMDVALGCN